MYNLTLGQIGYFNQNNQPEEPCVFHAPCFSQNKHPFGQCKHLNQVEYFEKL